MAATSATPHSIHNDILPALELERIAPDDLRMLKRKVRKVDPAHVREVAGSMSKLGFCDPVSIGKDNLVIDGDVRVEVAKLLRLSTVPCVCIDHLTDAEQRTLQFAINRLGERGEWDVGKLKIEFEELILADAPIEITGLTLDEIDHIILEEDSVAAATGPLVPEPGAVAHRQAGRPVSPRRSSDHLRRRDRPSRPCRAHGRRPTGTAHFGPTSLTMFRSPAT